MASSLFGARPMTNNIPSDSRTSNLFAMIGEFNQFKQSMAGKNPQEIVQQMLQSGQMTKEQFQQLGQMATQLQNILK